MASGGSNDIDSLKFSVVLDTDKFEKEMKRVEGLTKKFEKSVRDALAITNLLDAAQGKGAKATKEKAKAQKEVVMLTRAELEAKKAAGTLTEKEAKHLKTLIDLDKKLLDEQNKQLSGQKKQLDIQSKQEKMARQREAAERSTGEAITLNSNQLLRQSGILRGLGSMVSSYFSVFGAATVVRNLVRITGEFEAQHTALRAILQDSAAADNIYNQLQVLAVRSPFTFQNLVGYAKQLTAFSVPVNEVFETTKKLADVSAGLGVDMGRIILAYGQVRSAEFLRGQEVRQFTEAGIPILAELAKQFQEIEGHAISVGEVFDRISARQVPFEMVEEAFNRMTSAGGKFYNMQEVLAETVKGKVSNLQDAWEIMLSKIGDEHSGTIKGIITQITNLLANYERWVGILAVVIRYLGFYSSAMLVLNTVTRTFNSLQALKNGLEMIQNSQLKWYNILLPTNIALEKVSVATKKEEVAVLAALNLARKGAVAIFAALGAIIGATIARYKKLREEEQKSTAAINAALGKMNATMADFEIGIMKVESAFKKMRDAEGDASGETKKFHQSIDELKKQFPKFVDDHLKMAGSVDELRLAWSKAREEMNQYYADEARESMKTELQQDRDSAIGKLSKKFTGKIAGKYTNSDVGNKYARMAWRYVTGELGEEDLSILLNAMIEGRLGEYGYAINDKEQARWREGFLNTLKSYASQYKAIVDVYKDGLEDFEDLLDMHALTTERSEYNQAIFQKLFGRDATIEGMRAWLADPGNDLAVGAEQTVEEWAEVQREKLADANIPDTIKGVIRDVFAQFGVLENPNEITGWRKDVNDIISGSGAGSFEKAIRAALGEAGYSGDVEKFVSEAVGSASKHLLKPTDSFADKTKDWKKELDEAQGVLKNLPQQFVDFTNDVYTTNWLRELLFQTISEGLYGEGNVDFNGTTKGAKAEAKERERKAKEAEQKRKEWLRNQINNTRQEFQDLKELKAAYDSFKGLGFDDKSIEGLLVNFFGKGLPSGGLDTAFEAIAKRFEKLGDKNAAQDVRNFVAGKDWREYSKNVKDAQKATKKWEEALEDLRATTKRLNLDGFAADLDKIIVDADSKNRQFATKWQQDLEELSGKKDGWIAKYKIEHPTSDDKAANDAWVAYYNEQKDALDALLKANKEYNNKVAQRQIDKKADEWVKAMLDEKNIDLSNLNDKTMAQLDTLITRLKGLKSELPTLIPDALKEDANKINASFDTLLELIEKILQTKIDDIIDDKELKKVKQLSKDLKSIGNYLGNIGSAISGFGGDWEGVGDALGSAGSAMSSMSDIYEKMNTGAMSKGAGTASYIMIAIENIASVTARAIENFREMEEATKAWNLELKKSDYKYQLALLDKLDYEQANVFGIEGPYSKALAASKQLRAAQSDLLGLTKQIAGVQVKTGQKEVQDWGDTAKTILEMTAAGAAIGAAAGGGVFSWLTVGIGALAGLVTGALVSAFTDKKMIDVFESLGSLAGGKIFDPETLELSDEILSKYDQLDEAGKLLIDQWQSIKEKMKEAIGVFKENVDAVVGDIGKSVEDSLIAAFNSGSVYDAVDDLHDYIGKVIQDLLTQVAMAKFLQPLFDELQKDMYHSFGLDEKGNPLETLDSRVDYDWVDDLARFDSKLEPILPKLQEGLEDAYNKLESLGYTWNTGEEKASSSLGNGIKSITEDTANLLASYLNAIRADVSYGKTQWERIAVAVEGQNGRYITLNDYMQQVAANTFDTAQNTQRLVERVDAFIRDFSMPSSLGESIKVQVVNN